MIKTTWIDYTFDDEKFHRDVKRVVEETGIHPEDLGEAIGKPSVIRHVSAGTYWHRNTRPTVDTLLKICNLLDLNPQDYFILAK